MKVLQIKSAYQSKRRRQILDPSTLYLSLGAIVTEQERDLARRACARGAVRRGMSAAELREIFDALDLGKRAK